MEQVLTTRSAIKSINELINAGDLALASQLLDAVSNELPPLLKTQKLAELSWRSKTGVIYIDITDYIIFFRNRTVVSGIQRVVHSLIKYLPKSPRFEGALIRWCMTHPVSGLFSLIDNKHLNNLVISVEGSNSRDIAACAEEIIRLGSWSEDLPFGKKDSLLIPGGPWATPIQLCIYERHKVHQEFFVLVVCYDIIPIQYPEFCSQALVDVFEVAYDKITNIADAYVSISSYTSTQIRDYEVSLGRMREPSRYSCWRLGDYDDNFSAQSLVFPLSLQSRIPSIEPGFVLVVSTIEPRKNHYNLLRAWRLLSERLPASVVLPTLVLAGKIGWNSSDFMQQVQALNRSGIKVLVLEDLDDSSIAWLYSNCSFVVMPSYVEGWGLSITESLMRGKPCIASSTSSMVEASQGICPLFDPHNMQELTSIMYDFIVNGIPHDLDSKIKSYIPVSWEESVMNFCLEADLLIAKGPDTVSKPTPINNVIDIAPQQEHFIPSATKDQRAFMSYSCWYPIEGEHGYVRSQGKSPYIKLRFAELPVGILIITELLPGITAARATLGILGTDCILVAESAEIHGHNCEYMFHVPRGELVDSCVAKIQLFASTSKQIMMDRDPRLSAFALKSIEFIWDG